MEKIREQFEEMWKSKYVTTLNDEGEYRVFELQMRWEGFSQAYNIFKKWDTELDIVHKWLTEIYEIEQATDLVCKCLDEIQPLKDLT